MSKHTPGPWKAHKLPQKIGFAEWEIHYSDDGECVAEIVHKEEDARLIAESPAMYELLKELEKELQYRENFEFAGKITNLLKRIDNE